MKIFKKILISATLAISLLYAIGSNMPNTTFGDTVSTISQWVENGSSAIYPRRGTSEKVLIGATTSAGSYLLQVTGNQVVDNLTITGTCTGCSSGSGVTSIASADGSITVTNPTTTADLAVVKAPKLTTARTINGTSFDGTANITVTAAAGTLTGTTLNSTVVSSSLTSVGTVTSGTWNGTTIAIANGGTGQTTASAAFNALSPMTTAGDIIYGGTSGAGTRLAKGTATQLLHSGTTPSWSAVSLTADVSGTLPVANGGTGVTSAQGNGTLVQLSSGTTTTNDCVKFDANGNTVDAGSACGSGSTSPGGSNTQVQFNNSSAFGGSANLTWVSPTLTIGVAGATKGQLALAGNTSGTATIVPTAAAGTITLTIPATTGTIITSGDSGTVNGTIIASSVALAGSPTTTTQSAGDNSTKVATTAYVTTGIANAIAAVNPAVAVQAASAAKLPNSPTYNNGASGIGAFITTLTLNTALVVDGYTPALNDRILVKNEGDSGGLGAAKNGVYYVSQLHGVGLAWILTRALDYDQPSDMNNTGAIPVMNGTVNIDTMWLQTSQVTTVGTDAVTFTQFSYNPSTVLQNTLTSAHIFVGNGSNVATDTAVSGDITISNAGVTAIGSAKVTNAMLAGSITAAKLVGTDIATVGTITSGTWNGSVITGTYGGTGVNNGSNTITLANNLTTSGNFGLTLTTTATTNATLPAGTKTLVATDVATLSSLTSIGTIGTGIWQGTAVGIAYGGTGGSITASNGGIVYSDASRLQLLAGTATAGQIIRSGASTAPTWSTATYPATAGTSGNVLTSDGTNWSSSAPAGAVSTKVEFFSSSGTWTKPANAQSVYIVVIGAGGGGGSGRKGNTLTNRYGGASGGGGALGQYTFPASILGSTETITVGTGGTGGASQTTNATNGNAGTDGGSSSFGSWLTCGGGTGGTGGQAASGGTSGSGGSCTIFGVGDSGGGGSSGSNTTGFTNGNTTNTTSAQGGGSGAGADTSDNNYAGATGGGIATIMTVAGGTAGNCAGAGCNAGNGTVLATNAPVGGSGGGGGGSANGGAAAGSGGNGGAHGGGGGGGGAGKSSGANSGAGGSGGDGFIMVVTSISP